MTNLKQVLRALEDFQKEHLQLNSFRFGDVSEFLSNGDLVYPALLCDLEGSTPDLIERRIVYNITFFIADLSNVSGDTRENEVEVLSDITEIAQDLLSLFGSLELMDEWELVTSSDIEYSIAGNEDCAILLKFTVGIGLDFVPNACRIPTGDKNGDNSGFDYSFDFFLGDGLVLEGGTQVGGFDYEFDFEFDPEPVVAEPEEILSTIEFNYAFDLEL